jgi:hypothetical protein
MLEAKSDRQRMKIVKDLEEKWEIQHLLETDKAWNAIHRTLTDGYLLYDNGNYPLNLVICGGLQLHTGDEYTISYISSEEVFDCNLELLKINKSKFTRLYNNNLAKVDDYEDGPDQVDLDYTWSYFENLKTFFASISKKEMAMIFTVDA